MSKNFKFQISNFKKGQAVITVVIITLLVGMVIAFGVTEPAVGEAKISRELMGSKKVFAVAEAGQEDVSYRIRSGMDYDTTEILTIGEITATTDVSENVSEATISISTVGEGNRFFRKKGLQMVRGDEINFNYGIQVGNGGFIMQNSSSVRGNVYSNSTVTGVGNYIYGGVASAGSSGLVDDIHATGTVRSHSIVDSTIEGDAYYTTIEDSTVFGTPYPDSQDPSSQDMPISDETLDEWENAAAEGGIISSPCPYNINEEATIGPIKINCDLKIKTQDTVTIAGPVWVVGDISFETGPTVVVDSSFGSRSVVMIADNPANRLTQSIVTIKNTSEFEGSGTEGSIIMLVSRNRSAEDWGTVSAIDLQQSASGDILLYSNHGKITIAQSSSLKEVTGWLIVLKNTAEVIYDQGLASSLFDTGPGGSWNVSSWKETD